MVSVIIHSLSTVFPTQPTPNGILPLSESDQLMGQDYIWMIYVFKASDPSSLAYDSLRNSLSQVLVPFYPLAGRLRWIGSGRLELDCCAAGAQFIQASSHAKLGDYEDFAPTNAVRQLLPVVDFSAPVEELPLLLVQVTRFSCGGLSIGIAISHTEVDGISAIKFMNVWASFARGEKTMDTILKPYHDRDFLQTQKPPNPPSFHHQEYDEPPLMIGRSNTKEEQKKEFTIALFKVTKEQVEKLKKRANEPNLKPTDQNMDMLDELQPMPPYSRFECVASHLWVSACKARNTGESRQPTVINFAVDIRRRLRSPLPQGFFGNATLVSVTPMCELGDLITKPLSYAAGKIRDGTRKYTEEYVKSALNFLASQEDILEWTTTSPPYWGNPNMELTCLLSQPTYDADFGWGRPYYVGPAAIYFDGESYIVPGPGDDGSVVIVLGLQTKHMDDFKKFFYEDLDLRRKPSKETISSLRLLSSL